jgi:hypothetical protein
VEAQSLLAQAAPRPAEAIRPAEAAADLPRATPRSVRTQAHGEAFDPVRPHLELAAADRRSTPPAAAPAAPAAGPAAAVRPATWEVPIEAMPLAAGEAATIEPAVPSRAPAAPRQTAPPMQARPTAPIPLMKAQYAQATDARAAEVGINVRLDVPAEEREVSAPLLPRQDEPIRQATLKQFGGNDQTEQAVGKGLIWLAANQEPDGSWTGGNRQARSALAGLSLLSFLGQGHTHVKDGPHRETVGKGIRWLTENQKPDGDLMCGGQMYGHAIATIALCEALAMTGEEALKKPCRLAVKFILDAQAPAGGWRYRPKEAGDTSVLGWCAMALKSAQMAGIDVPESAWKSTAAFLDRVSTGPRHGLYGYTAPTADKPALTCEGFFVRLLMGESPETPRNQESIELAMKHLPAEQGQRNFYLYYYATLALHYANAPQWDQWNRKLQDALIKTQNAQGDLAGSWNPNTTWGSHGGRVYSTAMAVLMLEVYYRYLPMYRPEDRQDAPEPATGTP